MTRSAKWLFFGLAFAGILLIGPARNASAASILQLTAVETAGPTLIATDQDFVPVLPDTVPDSNLALGTLSLGSTTTPVVFGDFLVSGSVSKSNAALGGASSDLQSSSLSVVNTDTVAHTITLMITSTGYTFPTTPLLLVSTASGTFSPDDPNTSILGATAHAQSWADNTNTPYGTQFVGQNFSFTSTKVVGGDSYSNTADASPFGYTTNYSMTVELTFTVPGLSELDSRSDVIQGYSITPEPTTFVGAVVGLPLLGLLAWRRRRHA